MTGRKSRRDDAIAAVVRAVTVPGPAPRAHDEQLDRLAREWPALAGALAALVDVERQAVPPRWRSMPWRRQ